MGSCQSYEKKKKQYDKIPIEASFNPNYKYNPNIPIDKSTKSEFYLLTDFLLKFHFYKRIKTSSPLINSLTDLEDPKSLKVFKLVKAIDQLDEKDFSEFSSMKSDNTYSLGSCNSNFANKQKNNSNNVCQINSTLRQQFSAKSENLLTELDYESKLNSIYTLLNKLYYDKPKKFQKILSESPPNNLRWLLWKIVAEGKYKTIHSVNNISNSEIYQNLISLQITDKDLLKRINVDIQRMTSNYDILNNENWKQGLFNMLKCMALYDKKLSVWLGMNQIATYLLIISDGNPEESFLVLRFLFSNFYGVQLKNFYDNDFHLLRFYCNIVYKYLDIKHKDIYSFIKKNDIIIENWIFPWMQNLFSDVLGIDNIVRIIDCIIAFGSQFLIDFTIHFILYMVKNNLLNLQDKFAFIKNCRTLINFNDKKHPINTPFESVFRECFNNNIITSGFINYVKSNYISELYEKQNTANINIIKNYNYYEMDHSNLNKYFKYVNNHTSNEEAKILKELYNKYVKNPMDAQLDERNKNGLNSKNSNSSSSNRNNDDSKTNSANRINNNNMGLGVVMENIEEENKIYAEGESKNLNTNNLISDLSENALYKNEGFGNIMTEGGEGRNHFINMNLKNGNIEYNKGFSRYKTEENLDGNLNNNHNNFEHMRIGSFQLERKNCIFEKVNDITEGRMKGKTCNSDIDENDKMNLSEDNNNDNVDNNNNFNLLSKLEKAKGFATNVIKNIYGLFTNQTVETGKDENKIDTEKINEDNELVNNLDFENIKTEDIMQNNQNDNINELNKECYNQNKYQINEEDNKKTDEQNEIENKKNDESNNLNNNEIENKKSDESNNMNNNEIENKKSDESNNMNNNEQIEGQNNEEIDNKIKNELNVEKEEKKEDEYEYEKQLNTADIKITFNVSNNGGDENNEESEEIIEQDEFSYSDDVNNKDIKLDKKLVNEEHENYFKSNASLNLNNTSNKNSESEEDEQTIKNEDDFADEFNDADNNINNNNINDEENIIETNIKGSNTEEYFDKLPKINIEFKDEQQPKNLKKNKEEVENNLS